MKDVNSISGQSFLWKEAVGAHTFLDNHITTLPVQKHADKGKYWGRCFKMGASNEPFGYHLCH